MTWRLSAESRMIWLLKNAAVCRRAVAVKILFYDFRKRSDD
jgi:hypothetical protein